MFVTASNTERKENARTNLAPSFITVLIIGVVCGAALLGTAFVIANMGAKR
jgi:hypothetical protein